VDDERRNWRGRKRWFSLVKSWERRFLRLVEGAFFVLETTPLRLLKNVDNFFEKKLCGYE